MGETRQQRTDAQRGFIIVAVLWMLGALATLTMIYALYVRETTIEFVGHDERLEAQALASAGIELAAYQLTASVGERPLLGRFAFRQGSAAITVAFRCENARIDLNFAAKDVFAGLFAGFGVGRELAYSYADRIVAWRTPLLPGAVDAEADLYRAAGKNYGPRHGPFQHPDELTLVADLPPPLVERILPYVTVYSGHPEVNVLIAPPQVLAALPGMTPERLQFLLALRQSSPRDVVRAQFGASSSYVTVDGSRADRVAVDVQFRSGRREHTEAVIMLSEADTAPYRVLSWRDDEPSADHTLVTQLP
jgi:general secretion pathway protein K